MEEETAIRIKKIAIEHNPFSGPEIEAIVPCTEPQVEILTACLMGGNDASLAFNESVTLRFTGAVDPVAMEYAFQKLITRHQSLRSAFSIKSKHVFIFKNIENNFSYIDISFKDELKKQQFVLDYIRRDSLHLFDLVNGPLFKGGLIKINESEYNLVLTGHHIVCDGWSLGIILQDLGILYSAYVRNIFVNLPKPALYSQFAREQVNFLSTAEYEEIEKFWLQQFNHNVPVLDLPTDFARPAIRTYKSNRLDFKLDPEIINALKSIGATTGCSLVTTLMVAFETFLHRLTGQEDIVIGLPAAGQSVTENYYLVGHCVNLLPLRSNPSAGISFVKYLEQRKTGILDAYDHQQLTFGSLLQKLKIPRDPSRIPMVPVIFNIDMGMDNDVSFHGLKYQLLSNPRQYENFELFLNVAGVENDVTLEWSYNTQLFKAETIERMMNQFELLLTKINLDPNINLGDIDLGNDAVNTHEELNRTEATYPAKALHYLISETASKYPGKIALCFGEQELSYRELEERSNQLAHYLIQQGVMPGNFVGVALDRSPEMVITLLAIMKAGAAYIPLDPGYPEDRIFFILKDAAAKLLITSKNYEKKFAVPTASIHIEDALEKCRDHAVILPGIEVSARDLVYVLYTSGSTGQPKGVLIEHRSLVNFLFSMMKQPGFSGDDILLAVTTISFDISGLELFLPLVAGATIILADADDSRDGKALLRLVEDRKVSVMQATPSTWKMMLASGWEKEIAVKLLCGGEALPKDLANKLIPKSKALWNMYGPTETTIWSTCKQVFITDEIITIGRPVNNTEIYILDEAFNILPQGVIGEIGICGDGLARGYWNREDLTKEKFLSHPFDASKKMYRTGDLGKLLPGGEIQCLGRIDTQIKIRGYRVETGEIENTLEAISGIKEAVVLCKENKLGDARLVAYVVPENEINTKAGESKEMISQWKIKTALKLPAYMVPAHFELMTSLPLTPNGKIDRNSLPDPFDAGGNPEEAAPGLCSKEEEIISAIWQNLLDIKDIGLHDNFFESGGHSLIAIEVMTRIEKQTGKKLPPSILFQYPTIAKLATVINDNSGVEAWKSLVGIKTSGNKDPLYIIHGAGLDVMVFNNIARHMDKDQPVYGVKAKGKDGDDEALENIEDMAAFYISEIVVHNPAGPYALIGFSAGSVIAFEMSRQLIAMKRQVKILGIIDYDLEEHVSNNVFSKKIDKNTIQFFPRMFHVLKSLVQHPVKAYKYQVMCLQLRYEGLLARLGRNKKAELEGYYLHIENAREKHDFALKNYTVKPVQVAIDLFSTKTKVYYLKDVKFLGWKPYALQGIKIHKIPGDHDDMLLPPNDKEFADILQKALDNK